jgi:3-deoxy-D-manno-octulosonate 8-phosphate phosphatase (KDO 8-P phosphatase)
MDPELQRRAAAVRLLLLDVDGVLTDGTIFNLPGAGGATYETKGFHSQDGISLQWLVKYGIQTGVVSGRASEASEFRAKQIGMTYIYLGHLEKLPVLDDIRAKSGLAMENIAYAGDDLVDVPVMRRVGLAFAPANARAEVKRAAHFVTAASGGAGAVREMVEILLRAAGQWPAILKHYEVE